MRKGANTMHQAGNKGIFQQKDATSQAEAAWELIEQSTRDEEFETEASQDLDLMQANTLAHLTTAICRHLLSHPNEEASIKVVLPHLCRCSGCRGALHETLRLCGQDGVHPLYALLNQAEEWACWEAAGQQATLDARQHLHDRGINIVYARDEAIWEEHQDGTVERDHERQTTDPDDFRGGVPPMERVAGSDE